jgi:hypothetical protein
MGDDFADFMVHIESYGVKSQMFCKLASPSYLVLAVLLLSSSSLCGASGAP